MKARGTIALGVALLALFTLPYWLTRIYYVNVASQILFYAIFALGVNMLLGYAGLVSLGHAGLFGIASYATAYLLAAGFGHTLSIVAALVDRAVLDRHLRRAVAAHDRHRLHHDHAWRWAKSCGVSPIAGSASPMATTASACTAARQPFGFSLASATRSITSRWSIFLLAVIVVAIFVRSPFGAALKGTRDQPRRMNALGYHVWMIRFWACMFSGLLTCVAGILFVYYTQFISPQTLALTSSAEVVLMVISGGPATLLGPIVGAALVVVVKSVVSGFIERWNFLLGAIFVAIVILMPEGLVPGTVRLWKLGWRKTMARPRPTVIAKTGEPAS